MYLRRRRIWQRWRLSAPAGWTLIVAHHTIPPPNGVALPPCLRQSCFSLDISLDIWGQSGWSIKPGFCKISLHISQPLLFSCSSHLFRHQEPRRLWPLDHHLWQVGDPGDSLNKVHFSIGLAFDILTYSAQMIITSMDVHTEQVISGGNANIWAFLPVLRTVSIPWASGLFDVGGGLGLRLLWSLDGCSL